MRDQDLFVLGPGEQHVKWSWRFDAAQAHADLWLLAHRRLRSVGLGHVSVMSDASDTPSPGEDSRVEDWFGQSVERDTELAESLTDELGEDDAEKVFNEVATGEDEQEARHGDQIDPDQGRSAYSDPASS